MTVIKTAFAVIGFVVVLPWLIMGATKATHVVNKAAPQIQTAVKKALN